MAGSKTSSQATSSGVSQTVSALRKSYLQQTPDRLKFIDAFLAFIVLCGVFQFAYCVLVTNFPFNAFLAGYVVHRRWVAFAGSPDVQIRELSRTVCSHCFAPRTSQPRKPLRVQGRVTREVRSPLVHSHHIHQCAYTEHLPILPWVPSCSTFLYSTFSDNQPNARPASVPPLLIVYTMHKLDH